MIQRIQLINITTHKNSIIEFKRGINSLMGDNGAGKSTVLQMIGFVLFDFLPGRNQKQYVRIGAKENFGEVKLWIIGRDGEEYMIYRTIGKPKNELSVTHTQTGIILKDINSLQNFREWVHLILGIRSDLPLKTIFENGIGVRQGTFTEPFLRNPTGRALVFAPLLNVDIYSKLFKNFLHTIKDFENEIHEKGIQKSGLEGELKIKPELEEREKIFSKKIKKIKKDIQMLNSEWKKVHKHFAELEKIKEEITTIQKTIDILKQDVSGQEKMLKELANNLREAKKAQDICMKSEENYQKYKELEKKNRILSSKIRVWRQNKDKLTNFEKKLAELQTQKKQLDKEITEIEKLKDELPNLEKIHQKFEKYNQNAEKLRIQKDRIVEKEKISTQLKKELKLLNTLPKKQQKINAEYENIQKELQELEKLENKVKQNQIDLKTHQNQIKELKLYIKQANNGICPVCDQPYNNPHKDLKSYFAEKIEIHEKKVKELSNLIKNQNIKLKQKSVLQKRRDRCVELISQYREQMEQLKRKQRELDELKPIIETKQSILNQISELEQKIEQLKDQNQRYNFVTIKVQKELINFQASAYNVTQKINKIKKEMEPIEQKVEEGKDLEKNQMETQNSLEKYKSFYDLYQKNQKLAIRLPEFKQKLEGNRIELESSKKDLKNHTIKLNSLLKNFDEREFSELEMRQNHIQTKMIQKEEEFKHVKNDLDDIKRNLSVLKNKEEELSQIIYHLEKLIEIKEFSELLRTWFKEAGPKITEALISNINQTATAILRQIKEDSNLYIEWQKDYDVILQSEKIPKRNFSQLSGGEQMAVALAIRLSILKILTQIDFAFFDEPTTNLDEATRRNLAQSIQNVRGFEQIFVISHDDTFADYADYKIRLSKNEDEITNVEIEF
ncbi:MAG: AAA family ATPase [Candidatus Lokiarchaeota archaeon]|nr:AAA family ATPase [Candidatus Harpocratesius repetitus]